MRPQRPAGRACRPLAGGDAGRRILLALACLIAMPLSGGLLAQTEQRSGFARADAGPQRPVPAQCTPDPWAGLARALANEHAPVLEFGQGERYFPTLPFFTAFDGVPNTVHKSAVTNGQELAPGHPGIGTHLVSWQALDTAYLALGGTAPKRIAVLYGLHSATWGSIASYLRSDRQAWHRTGIERRVPLADSTAFLVVQYFLFYVTDAGLQGHPIDREHVFVFVPADSALRTRVRVVVGDAHGRNIPNNVVVEVDYADTEPPRVMVELGGHASAPDVRPHGVLLPGQDPNWHTEHVWGIRDLQAISGQAWGGPYVPYMTLPRDSSIGVFAYPPRDSGRVAALSDTAKVHSHRYSLVPIDLLDCLFTRAAEEHPDARAVDSLVGALLQDLGPGWSFARVGGDADSTLAETLRLMRLWNGPVRLGNGRAVSADGHLPWRHGRRSGRPEDVFKTHIFAPSLLNELGGFVNGDRPIVRAARMWRSGGRWKLGVAAPLPTPRFLALPGSWELGATWVGFMDDRPDLGINVGFVRHEYELLTWFGGTEVAVRTGDVTLQVGLQLTPRVITGLPAKIWSVLAIPRYRVGLDIDLDRRNPRLGAARWVLGLEFN